MKKKIIIIGAGIAGLSAGCYGRLNGYDTVIFEMHNIPGGLCMAWKRKGYTIDGCIERLMGISPRSEFHSLWNEIGALDGRAFVTKDHFYTFADSAGRQLTLHADINETEAEMLRLAPEDAPLIRELAAAVRKFSGFRLPVDKPQDLYHPLDYAKALLKMGPFLGMMGKYNKMSIGDFAGQFKNPFLKESLLCYAESDLTMFCLILALSTYHNRDAAWPVGGSLEFAEGIEKRYRDLGGRIVYRAKVESILVENHHAVGVRLADGAEHRADHVIWAADGHTAIFKMLRGAYANRKIRSLYENTALSSSSVQVSLGITCALPDNLSILILRLDQPIMVGDVPCHYIPIHHYGYDKTMCPPGKSVIRGNLYTNHDYWEKLYRDKKAYKLEKERIAQEYIKVVEGRYPQAKGNIEMVDVSTPMTYVRYTGTWKGVYMGRKLTTRDPMITVPARLPGLQGFYLAGQWAFPSGGLPPGLLTGKFCVMRICRDDGRKMR